MPDREFLAARTRASLAVAGAFPVARLLRLDALFSPPPDCFLRGLYNTCIICYPVFYNLLHVVVDI
jgi:hypothetical protein